MSIYSTQLYTYTYTYIHIHICTLNKSWLLPTNDYDPCICLIFLGQMVNMFTSLTTALSKNQILTTFKIYHWIIPWKVWFSENKARSWYQGGMQYAVTLTVEKKVFTLTCHTGHVLFYLSKRQIRNEVCTLIWSNPKKNDVLLLRTQGQVIRSSEIPDLTHFKDDSD